MSNLILVRHGQASFGAENYDQLSPLGETQAATLGYYWANKGTTFDGVFVGPLQRQQQTWEAVRTAYEQQGSQLPAPILMPAFDEHQGMQIFEENMGNLARRDDQLGQSLRALTTVESDDEDEARRWRLRAYLQFTHLWARGDIDSGTHEPWRAFYNRVVDGIKTITKTDKRGQQLVVFTSGGVIAAVVGFTLGISAGKAIELNGALLNTAYTSFRFSTRQGGLRISLNQFNAYPHLDDAEELTYI